MEKQNPSSVPSIFRHNNSGVIKLPPGFRFQPTDEELVLQYLRRKVFSYPLHASFIPEVDLSKQNPWDLPVCGREQERYFFALRETKYANGTRTNRATEGGYWKATGKDRVVLATKCGRSIALKQTLVFHKGKAPRGQKTDWIMHEYSLAISNILSQRKNLTINGAVGMKDWVLCRIFKKKRSTKLVNHFTGSNSRESDERHPSSPAHSDSSCVTNHAIEESANKVDITSSLH